MHARRTKALRTSISTSFRRSRQPVAAWWRQREGNMEGHQHFKIAQSAGSGGAFTARGSALAAASVEGNQHFHSARRGFTATQILRLRPQRSS
jgi:hypothetical protein